MVKSRRGRAKGVVAAIGDHELSGDRQMLATTGSFVRSRQRAGGGGVEALVVVALAGATHRVGDRGRAVARVVGGGGGGASGA